MKRKASTIIATMAVTLIISMTGCKQESPGNGTGACATDSSSTTTSSACVDNRGSTEGKK